MSNTRQNGSPKFEANDASFFKDAYFQEASGENTPVVENLLTDELIDENSDASENVFHQAVIVQRDSSEWINHYFHEAVELIKNIAETETNHNIHLDRLKMILGPEPVKKKNIGQPKTSYETRYDENSFQLILQILNFVYMQHEKVFHEQVMKKYHDNLASAQIESIVNLQNMQEILENDLAKFNKKNVKIDFSMVELTNILNFLKEIEHKIHYGIDVSYHDELKKEAQVKENNLVVIPYNTITLLKMIQNYIANFQSKSNNYTECKKKLDLIKEEIEKFKHHCKYIKEAKLIEKVDQQYAEVMKERYSWVQISYDKSGHRHIVEDASYAEAISQIVEDSRFTLAYNQTDIKKIDISLRDFFKLLSQRIKFAKSDALILDSDSMYDFEYIMPLIFKKYREKIIEQSVNDFIGNMKFENVPVENLESFTNDVRKKLEQQFTKPLKQLEKLFFENSQWKSFIKTKDITALYNYVLSETENNHKKYLICYNIKAPIAGVELEEKRRVAKAKYLELIEEWNTKNEDAKIAIDNIEVFAKNIINLRNNYEPLSNITDSATGDTLLHKASTIYYKTQDYYARMRLLKVMEVLFTHGADAFSTNHEYQLAYNYSIDDTKSMQDWKIAILQLENSANYSQYSELLINCLFQYAKNNNYIYNESSMMYYLNGYWKDQKIKLERLGCVWNILAEINLMRSSNNDKFLLDNVGRMIYGEEWQRKDSSQLRTMLQSDYEKGVGQRIMIIESPQQVIVNNLTNLHKEMSSLRIIIAEEQKKHSLPVYLYQNMQIKVAGTEAANLKLKGRLENIENKCKMLTHELQTSKTETKDTKQELVETKQENEETKLKLNKLEVKYDHLEQQMNQILEHLKNPFKNAQNDDQYDEQNNDQPENSPKFFHRRKQ